MHAYSPEKGGAPPPLLPHYSCLPVRILIGFARVFRNRLKDFLHGITLYGNQNKMTAIESLIDFCK